MLTFCVEPLATEGNQRHYGTALTQMELGRLLLIVSVLVCVLDRVCGNCFVLDSLHLCPSPVIVRPPKLNTLRITCMFTIPPPSHHEKIELGVVKYTSIDRSSFRFYRIVIMEVGHRPTRCTKLRCFTPEGFNHIEGWNSSSVSLTIVNATLSDLDNEWVCVMHYSYQTMMPFHAAQAIPYPENSTLTVSPSKSTYHSHDIVNLRCTAFSSMNFTTAWPERLRYTFQYWYPDNRDWVSIHDADSLQTSGVVVGAPVLEGHFIVRTYTLRLRVSSIPACYRKYRCLLSFESTSFEAEAPEVEINVTTCSGGCLPPGENETCLQEESTTVPQPTTSDRVRQDEEEDWDLESKKQSANVGRGMMIGLVVSGVLSVLSVLLIILYIIRRMGKKRDSQAENYLAEYRMSSTLPVTPQSVNTENTSSARSSFETTSDYHSETSAMPSAMHNTSTGFSQADYESSIDPFMYGHPSQSASRRVV